MKKLSLIFIALILCFSLCFSLTACSKSDKEKSSGGSLSSQKVDSDYSKTETEEEQNPESSVAKRRYMSELEAKYSAHEKNGYSLFAIVHSGGSELEDYNLCVDSKGYVTFDFPENESFQTKVYNGAFITKEDIREKQDTYIKTNTVYRVRRASDGKVLYTADETNNDSIIELEYSSDSLFKDGYILALNTQESYNGVTYKLGVLGTNGEWIVPMTADNPVVKAMSEDTDAKAEDFKKMRYLGEDILYFEIRYITKSYESVNKHYFYNLKKNIVTEVDSELTASETGSVLQCAGPFYNGVCVEPYGFGGGICKITTDAKITAMPINFNEKLHENEGAMYYDLKNDRVIRIGYTYHEDGFSLFDSKGAIIKKIPDVTLDHSSGFNNKGFAEIVMKNKEGTTYSTLIDINGEFMFEPTKAGSVIYLPNVDMDSSEAVSGSKIMDENGKFLYEAKDSNTISFKNGIVKDGEEYIEIIK